MIATIGLRRVAAGFVDGVGRLADRVLQRRGVDHHHGVDVRVGDRRRQGHPVVVGRAAPRQRLRRRHHRRAPARTSEAVASTVGLFELLTTHTRRPFISGCVDSVRTVSSNAVTVGTSITPVWA